MDPDAKKPAVLEASGSAPSVPAARLFSSPGGSPASSSSAHALGASFDTQPPASAPASAPPPGSVSPRAVASRLMKILDRDEHSAVTPSLGPKSSSHPSVHFSAGGGFTSRRAVETPLTAEELDADYQRRMQGWELHGRRGREPTKKAGATRVEMKGDLEYHPPGGIHSDYDPKLDDAKGGSYLRVKTQEPAPSEARYGRHGRFENTETFERTPLDPSARHRKGPAETAPPYDTGSPPPSPRTAGILADRLYTDPEALMQELASRRPYKEIAGTAGGGGAPAAAAVMPPPMSSSSGGAVLAPSASPSMGSSAPPTGDKKKDAGY